MSLYPTLCDLAGLETPGHVSGRSIVSLLANPMAEWGFPAITTHGRGNHSVKTQAHRYIRYANGDEELYDAIKDPFEWVNLASLPEHQARKETLASWLPTSEAKEKKIGKKAATK